LRVHLGSGHDVLEGYLNLDRVLLPGLDVVADLERTLPFRSDTIDEVLARHVFEHIEDLVGLLGELRRVCREGAVLRIVVPHFSSFTAYSYLTHRRFFGYHTFDQLTEGSVYGHQVPLRFELRRRRLQAYWIKNERRVVRSYLVTALINLWPLLYERFFCWWFPVHEVEAELVVRKGPTSERNSSSYAAATRSQP